MRLLKVAALATLMAVSATGAYASCEDGEIVIKFSHVTNTDKHPKGTSRRPHPSGRLRPLHLLRPLPLRLVLSSGIIDPTGQY